MNYDRINIISAGDIQSIQDYMHSDPTSVSVRNPSHWQDDAKDWIFGGGAQEGAKLPWSNHHHKFRFRPGETTIWSGYNFHGKSLMLSQVMADCNIQGQKVVTASMEMTPKVLIERMLYQLSGDIEPTEGFLDRFCRWAEDKVYIYEQVGTVRAETILAVARYCAERFNPHHFVIDSLMKCGIPTEDYARQKDFVDNVISIGKDTGMHMHLVAHSRKPEIDESKIPDRYMIKGASEISDMPDNVIITWRNKLKEREAEKPEGKQRRDILEKPDTLFFVDKQRNFAYDGIFGLWFNKDSQQFVTDKGRQAIPYAKEIM